MQISIWINNITINVNKNIREYIFIRTHGGTRTRSLQIRSLTRYPISLHKHSNYACSRHTKV